MTKIGEFRRTAGGFAGRIHTLALDATLCLVPANAGEAENAPDWRIHLGESDCGPEIGAAWNRDGERAGPYLSFQIDDPVLGKPIRANLFLVDAEKGLHHLRWSRPAKRDPAN